jgi:hypothetical protein
MKAGTTDRVETPEPDEVRPLERPTRLTNARVVDGAVLVLTLMAGVVAALDVDVPGRQVLALALVMFSPGWAFLRLVRAPLELFTVLLAASLSMAYTMLITVVLTTRLAWEWQWCAIVTATASAVMLIISLAQRPPPGDFDDAIDGDTFTTERPLTAPKRVGRAVRPYAFGIAGVSVAIAGIAETNIGSVGRWGLIDAVPAWYFLGTALIVVGVVSNLRWDDSRHFAAAWIHLIALVTVLHGVAAFAEPNPRFPVAWLHVAFADHLASGGSLLQQVDARFSWPGFFSGAGYLQRLAGSTDMLWALPLAPVFFNTLGAAIVFELARTLGGNRVRSTAAAMVFVLFNWIGQDYFAPQAIAFFLVFVILNLVLRNLSVSAVAARRWSRWAGTAAAVDRRYAGGARALTIGLVVALSGAVVVSHQLSPVMLICFLAGLAALQRASTARLTLIVGLIFAGWVAFAAEAYWLGNSSTLFGALGDVSTVVSQNVTERSQGGEQARQAVVAIRILTTLTMWLVAAVQLVLLRRQGRLDRALVALFLAAFTPLLLQPYGGEVLLRVALFSLPAAAILISSMRIAPNAVRGELGWRLVIPVSACAAVLVPILMINRYGNEAYEMITDQDQFIYNEMGAILDQRDPSDAGDVRVYTLASSAPLLVGRVDYYSGVRRIPRNPDRAIAVIREQLAASRDVYLIVLPSDLVQLEQLDGLDERWRVEYLEDLSRRLRLRVVSEQGDGAVIQVGGSGQR